MPPATPSNDEIGRISSLGSAAVKPRRAGALADVLDGNLVELFHDLFLERRHQGDHHTPAKLRAAVKIFLALVEAHGDAHYVADADPPALAGKAITAARTADPLQDSGPDELLHHLLKVALRHALARGDLLGLNRLGPRVIGDIDHRFEREQGLAGKPKHR